MSARPLLIVNPKSGGGRTGRQLGELREVIERAAGSVDVVTTERVGHAIALAEDAARGDRRSIVAMGGDGTLNEVVNGVMRSGRSGDVEITHFAQGTGGDFRRTLGVPHEPGAYARAIAQGDVRRIDVGRLVYRGDGGTDKERYFVNILSAGMGGLVDSYVAETSKALGGAVAYAIAGMRALAKCRRGQLVCERSLAGEAATERIASYMIAICNGQYFGSGMHVAPMAELDDGVFEIISIDADSKIGFAGKTSRIHAAGHLGKDGVLHRRVDRVRLDLENEEARGVFRLDCDGEPLGGLPITIEVVRRALRIRVPPAA